MKLKGKEEPPTSTKKKKTYATTKSTTRRVARQDLTRATRSTESNVLPEQF